MTCDKEHVTAASFLGLVRDREEARSEVEILQARVADLERRLCELVAAVDRARAEALEEAAGVCVGFERFNAQHIANVHDVAVAIRALKDAT